MTTSCHVLVTGGAGFIGSHVVDLLMASGCAVSVLDNLSTGQRANLRQWEGHDSFLFLEGDIRDDVVPLLARAAERNGPIARICHLAAQTAVPQSIADPVSDIEVNLSGTVRMLEYARHHGVAKVVFASSAAVYDNAATVPVSEDTRARPSSPYGINKRAAEIFLDYYARIHGVDFSALRFMNVYGARSNPSSWYSGVVSIFFNRALGGTPIVIYGDGEQTRDFVHVSDVAKAVVTACLSAKASGDVVNIGTGREVSINELCNTILELTGSSSPVRHEAARLGEIRRSATITAKAASALGFTAATSLKDGLHETLAWLRAAAE